jgi:hypothetical protein
MNSNRPEYKRIEREGDFPTYNSKEFRKAIQEAEDFSSLVELITTHLDLLKYPHPETMKEKRKVLGDAIKAWGNSNPGDDADRAWSRIQVCIDDLLNLYRWKGSERNVGAKTR